MSKKTVKEKSTSAEATDATGGGCAAPAGSVIPLDPAVVMEAEAKLMKAATEFAYQWGQNQMGHPKMYWLELHLARWRTLAVAAVEYAAEVGIPATDPDSQNAESSNRTKQHYERRNSKLPL